ncbi:MAG: hypothetical protein IPM74_15530 [Crocinitomicaceae bacterium]|nr:hypothetical protein [Crocinitomicaceae bacterium]
MKEAMNFSEIKNHCNHVSKISAELIDKYLLYYAAERENLEPYMNAQIKKYKQASRELHPSSLNIFKSEFIAHRIFKKDGLVHRYLQQSEIKKFLLSNLNSFKRTLQNHGDIVLLNYWTILRMNFSR